MNSYNLTIKYIAKSKDYLGIPIETIKFKSVRVYAINKDTAIGSIRLDFKKRGIGVVNIYEA